jgi:hypothetical protein
MSRVQLGQANEIKKFAFYMHKFAYLNKVVVLIHRIEGGRGESVALSQ